jgi:hypothetical protein
VLRIALRATALRVARELHDVVTHNVSMMVVQAGAARRILDASPDEARSALLAIEESGREAITELQHMLSLLTQPGDPDEAGPCRRHHRLRAQPGLDQVRPLIDRVTAAGLPVEFRVSGTLRAPHETSTSTSTARWPPGPAASCSSTYQHVSPECLTVRPDRSGQVSWG